MSSCTVQAAAESHTHREQSQVDRAAAQQQWSLPYYLQMRERLEAKLAVVLSHTRCADAAKLRQQSVEKDGHTRLFAASVFLITDYLEFIRHSVDHRVVVTLMVTPPDEVPLTTLS